MKKVFTMAMIAALTMTAFQSGAQEKKPGKKFGFGVGLESALPIGAFGTAYTVGIGSTVRMEAKLNNDMAVTATSGVMAFIPKSVKGVDLKAQLNIPIKAGLKYNLTNRFYTLGEAGITMAKVYYPTTSGSMQSVTSSAFTYAANIGTNLGKFDASLRYEGYKGSGFIGLRLGLNF